MSKLINHLKLVHIHRKFVRKACFKMGIPWQGLVHDLSKYSPTELSICKYYNGKRSPHEECRDQLGYSPCWIHHYHKNKHHWQFWLDDNEAGKFNPIKMPYKYVIESFCDMLGASKAYNKANWKASAPLDYWISKCEGKRLMHKDSLDLTRFLLTKLADIGETEFYKWYKLNKIKLKEAYQLGLVLAFQKDCK